MSYVPEQKDKVKATYGWGYDDDSVNTTTSLHSDPSLGWVLPPGTPHGWVLPTGIPHEPDNPNRITTTVDDGYSSSGGHTTAHAHTSSTCQESSLPNSSSPGTSQPPSAISSNMTTTTSRGGGSSYIHHHHEAHASTTSGWGDLEQHRSHHIKRRLPQCANTLFANIPLRPYQRQIATNAVGVAAGLGCVVNLPTGAGKTNIAVAVALHEIVTGFSCGIRAVVMIVPTRDLVNQQAEVFFSRIAENPVVQPLLHQHGVDSVVVTFKLGGRSIQRVERDRDGKISSVAVTTRPEYEVANNTKKIAVIFVATAEVYNTSVVRASPQHGLDLVASVPPLDVTSTVFFDEVHHCGKKHPYATTARTIHDCIPGQGPRIIGLSATLSYSSSEYQAETTSLLQMMRCGSGCFRNDDEFPFDKIQDPFASHERAFVFMRTMEQLVVQGYNHPGRVQTLSDGLQFSSARNELQSDETISSINAPIAYGIDLRAHELWDDMLFQLRAESRDSDIKTVLSKEVQPGRIHPLVTAAFMLAEELEPAVFNPFPPRGLALNVKTEEGEKAYQYTLGQFIEAAIPIYDGGYEVRHNTKTPAFEEAQRRACQLRITALYLHCCALVRIVTVTRQQELETALRGYLLYVGTTVESKAKPYFDHFFRDSYLDVRLVENVFLLTRKIKVEVNDNKNLCKFDELLQLLKRRIRETKGLRAIVFAENVAMCAIISNTLNQKVLEEANGIESNKEFNAEWYTSKTNAPYFNIPHRSPTTQKEILDKFRAGTISVLVGTTVLEEGIDVPEVKLTVHFTPPTNIVSMVQRQGRAREKDSESLLVDGTKLQKLQYHEQQVQRQAMHLQNIAMVPPVAPPTLNFESNQAFSANLDNFIGWLSGSETRPSEDRPYSQILNEMSQRLMAKSLGKITQSFAASPIPQKFKATVVVELRLVAGTQTVTETAEGLGKKKAICNAAERAIDAVRELLRKRGLM